MSKVIIIQHICYGHIIGNSIKTRGNGIKTPKTIKNLLKQYKRTLSEKYKSNIRK